MTLLTSLKAGDETEKRFPVIHSRTPGTLKLGTEGVYEFIPFP